MNANRDRDFRLDICGIALLLPLLAVPFVTTNALALSLAHQSAIGAGAALGVYVMLRLGLLSFMVPAFMALGGYAAALSAKGGMTHLPMLMAISVLVPAVVAMVLGALVLRLKGIYFIFVTFIVNEILQIVLFEVPALTGGSNGIAGVPPTTFPGIEMGTPSMLVFATVLVCVAAAVLALWITQRFRPEFTSLEENETLAESLGLAAWKYRTIGFVASAAVCGLTGFALVNMLSTAHPSSFASWSVNNYIAYVFIGGRGSILGVVVGTLLLVGLGTVFSSYAHLSAGMFGLLLIVVILVAPSGIVGTLMQWCERRKARSERVGLANLGEQHT